MLAEGLLARLVAGRNLRFSRDAVAWLRAYAFPGNVRELRNLLERACLLCDGDEIDLRHLPSAGGTRQLRCGAAGRSGRGVERPEPARVFPQFTGKLQKDLARQLGMSERTLYRRLKALEG